MAEAIMTLQNAREEEEEEESDDRHFPRMGRDVKRLRVAVACHASVPLETEMLADSCL